MPAATLTVPVVCSQCSTPLTALIELYETSHTSTWVCPACGAERRWRFRGALRWIRVRVAGLTPPADTPRHEPQRS